MNPLAEWRALDAEDRARLWDRMRVPVFSCAALVAMLAGIVVLGWFFASPTASYLEAGLSVGMIATVLLFSMEVLEEPPLMRFFSLLGFAWVLILFGMTMLDYISR